MYWFKTTKQKNDRPKYRKTYFQTYAGWLLPELLMLIIFTTFIPNLVSYIKTISIMTKPDSKDSAVSIEKVEMYDVLEHKLADENNLKYIIGKIRNNSGKETKYVQIQIDVYDKDGIQLGSTMDNITNLKVNGIWQFKATVDIMDTSKIASYKIIEITGF